MGRRPTLPPGFPGSTIGAGGLNFSVRNGKRCSPSAIAAGKSFPNGIALNVKGRAEGGGKPHPQLGLALKRTQRKASTTTERDGRDGRARWIGQAARLISTGRLKRLLSLHLRPIDLVVSEEPLGGLCHGRSNLGVCFALRCFQRLSRPNIATLRCPGQDNRYTRGSSVPVLSY